MKRFALLSACLGAVAMFLIPTLAPARTRGTPHVCQGTASKPGVLKGKFANGVEVKGYCAVSSGPAKVTGTLKVTAHSVLLAAYGMHNSKLTVRGPVKVGRGATFLLGCNTTSFPCIDDPNQSHPTLSSSPSVQGEITANKPLGVVIHSTTIAGDVSETGGGGGTNCTPSGPFAAFQSPVYSDFEDNTIAGNLQITDLASCWLGIARDKVNNMSLNDNKLADPDAIEVLANHVAGNLGCAHNKQHLWDSADLSQTGLYPRKLERNHVKGKRFGQCRKAGPLTQDGPPAGGGF